MRREIGGGDSSMVGLNLAAWGFCVGWMGKVGARFGAFGA